MKTTENSLNHQYLLERVQFHRILENSVHKDIYYVTIHPKCLETKNRNAQNPPAYAKDLDWDNEQILGNPQK